MKKTATNLLFMAFVLASAGLVFAQNTATANWPLTGSDTVSATVTGNVMADTESVVGLVPAYQPPSEVPDSWISAPPPGWTTGRDVQKLKPDASTSGSQTNYWPDESSYNSKRYVEFAVGPKSGHDMTVDSLSMWIGAKGIEGMVGVVYYSTHSDFSHATKLVGDTDTLSEHPSLVDTTFKGIKAGLSYTGLKISVNNGQKLYIRVYPFLPGGKESSSKYMYIGNVWVYGTTTKAVVTPDFASITWPLTEDDTTAATIAGNVMASHEGIAGLTVTYEVPDSGTTSKIQKLKPDDNTSGSSGPGSWPQETTYNADRYLEFSFGPKSGYDLTIDSLSMQIGDKGIKGMYADVYYSTDASFSDPQPLIQNDSLVEKAVVDTTLRGLDIKVTDGDTLYVRVYPWLRVVSTSTSKYLYLGNVVAYGSTVVSTPIEHSASTEPSGFELEQNFPNPFNPTTNITFKIPEKSMVTLKVYNILGKEVATLVQGVEAPGLHTVRFNGSGLASGVYIYRLQAGSFVQTRKLMLLK